MFSPELLDHFEHPRNAGILESPDASVQLENPVCGDVLRLSARCEDGRILEIRFQAKGCVPTTACASALTELALGKSTAAASRITSNQLVQALGGLPPASDHASALAIEALRRLIAQLKP